MPNDPSLQSNADALTPVDEQRRVTALGRQIVFEAVVATMWSVGELVAAEVERSRAALAILGIQPRRGGSAFGTIAAGPLPLTDLEFDALAVVERRLAYAAAEWVAATSVPSDRRAQFLRGLRLCLHLSDRDASELTELARAVDADGESARAAFAKLTSRVA